MTESPSPRIVTYESAEAPPSHRFVGFFFLGSKQLPVMFHRSDRAILITEMRDFWAEEQAKRAKTEANHAAHAARMRNKVKPQKKPA